MYKAKKAESQYQTIKEELKNSNEKNYNLRNKVSALIDDLGERTGGGGYLVVPLLQLNNLCIHFCRFLEKHDTTYLPVV